MRTNEPRTHGYSLGFTIKPREALLRFASSRAWLPWVLAGLPAFIAFFLPDLLPDGNFPI